MFNKMVTLDFLSLTESPSAPFKSKHFGFVFNRQLLASSSAEGTRTSASKELLFWSLVLSPHDPKVILREAVE